MTQVGEQACGADPANTGGKPPISAVAFASLVGGRSRLAHDLDRRVATGPSSRAGCSTVSRTRRRRALELGPWRAAGRARRRWRGLASALRDVDHWLAVCDGCGPFCGHTGTRCLPGNAKPAVCSGFRCGACRARTGDPQLAKPSGGDSGEGGSDPERPRLAGDSDDDEPALAGADPDASDRAVGQAFGWYRAPYVDDDPRSQRGSSCGSRSTRPVGADDAPG